MARLRRLVGNGWGRRAKSAGAASFGAMASSHVAYAPPRERHVR